VSDPAVDLATHIRTELSDESPQGFHFIDHVVRQDRSLERLTEQLRAHGDMGEVERAISLAISEERDGWTQLKLLELVERLELKGAAPSLMSLVERRAADDDDRGRFLAGRACEVMLKLPLDLDTRTRASELCKGPLEEVARFRMSAERVRAVHRPRRIEWAILVALMALGIGGLIFAFMATGR
jgi:hypothetical protein